MSHATSLVGELQRRQRRRGCGRNRVVDVNIDHRRERRGMPAPLTDHHMRPQFGPGRQHLSAGCFDADALERVLALPLMFFEGEQLCWHSRTRRGLAQCQPVPLECRRRPKPLAAVAHHPLRQGTVVPDLLFKGIGRIMPRGHAGAMQKKS